MRFAQIHANLAAFVLGRLEPKEAAEVRSYLAFCFSCWDEMQKPQKLRELQRCSLGPGCYEGGTRHAAWHPRNRLTGWSVI